MNSAISDNRMFSELKPSVLQFEVGVMAGRIAQLLRHRFAGDESAVASSLGFLDYHYEEIAGGISLAENRLLLAQSRQSQTAQALDRLRHVLQLSELEQDILILAGLAEHHEGYADIFRSLHPSSLPYPTLGLAAQIICPDNQRDEFNDRIAAGKIFTHRLVTLHGEEPLYLRHIKVAESMWPVLQGIDAWPADINPESVPVALAGLDEWLQKEDVKRASRVLIEGIPGTLVMTSDSATVAWLRGVALVEAAGSVAIPVSWPKQPGADFHSLLQLHLIARAAIPVIRMLSAENESAKSVPCPLLDFPATVVICSQVALSAPAGQRPMLNLLVEPLTPQSLREMWREILPAMSQQVDLLAARYPLEPGQAMQVAQDLALNYDSDRVGIEDVAAVLRARAAISLGGGVQLVRPVAGWSQLVLQESHTIQLREAVSRLDLQARVLDDWQFLAGRRGSRGVRMLLAGSPGTGKTLTAEVLAKALNVDLLLVDLSRVVSKWIGETEKNLAEVFETAERVRAVLFFDEAESLFGKRTEVNDSNDRYANLETAYLLSRLERFDGLAILATNLRQNIDSAFSRRLEYIIEYEEPGLQEREALWRCHLPVNVPLADDVNLHSLAANFPVVGGLIRNAAVTAAFMAAADGQLIKQIHFTRAIRREYEKAGKAFRELPVRTVQHGH